MCNGGLTLVQEAKMNEVENKVKIVDDYESWDLSGLIPMEEADRDDSECPIVNRPRGGTIDQILVKELRSAGFNAQDIRTRFGYGPLPTPDVHDDLLFLGLDENEIMEFFGHTKTTTLKGF